MDLVLYRNNLSKLNLIPLLLAFNRALVKTAALILYLLKSDCAYQEFLELRKYSNNIFLGQ